MFIIRKIYSFLIDTLQTILLAASVFIVIYIFLFRPFQVKGASMYPNFQDNEYVLTNIVTLKIGQIRRGDVIVFKAPTDEEKDYIKRVIGLGGDTISVKDGAVFINDEKLDESAYLKNDVKTYPGAFLQEGMSTTVPQGQYFVLGDNRSYSSDSREWGYVGKDAVIGMSFYIYWPLDKMSLVKNPYN
ncbi:MAG: signal peptidase I [Candidatus Levybacteria bacterium]|nr:signal peptidase I [Candidatus Levybacteria bacterium]